MIIQLTITRQCKSKEKQAKGKIIQNKTIVKSKKMKIENIVQFLLFTLLFVVCLALVNRAERLEKQVAHLNDICVVLERAK
jgi:hypothetical protein